jgi:hypothetical protein
MARNAYIVVVDMRSSNNRVCAIVEDKGQGQWAKQFRSEEAAHLHMKNHPLGAFPYQVVRVQPRPFYTTSEGAPGGR